MSLLQSLSGQGYLKAGFLGFQGSGKTFTATKVAIGAREFFGLEGPIAMFDTEGGAAYVSPIVKRETGLDLVGLRSRSLGQLVAMGKECIEAGVSILLVDSMTHVWRETCDSYLEQANKFRRKKGWKLKRNLEFQDWNIVKGKFAEWTDFYLNSPLHIVICGRAGYEYDFEESEDGKKELVKTGVKMKTEGEFGFEPSLLIEMQLLRDRKNLGKAVGHQGTVVKDRFDVVNGQVFMDPTFEDFKPHLEMLVPGAHAPIDVDSHTDHGLDDEGEASWPREKRRRTVACEEIQGLLLQRFPSQKSEDKLAKAALIFHVFQTRSWTAVEAMDSQRLQEGLRELESIVGDENRLSQVLTAEVAS